MAILNSYVKLPEGIPIVPLYLIILQSVPVIPLIPVILLPVHCFWGKAARKAAVKDSLNKERPYFLPICKKSCIPCKGHQLQQSCTSVGLADSSEWSVEKFKEACRPPQQPAPTTTSTGCETYRVVSAASTSPFPTSPFPSSGTHLFGAVKAGAHLRPCEGCPSSTPAPNPGPGPSGYVKIAIEHGP